MKTHLLALLGIFAAALPVVAQTVPAPSEASSSKKLYVVGYSHLDTQWRWTYVNTIREFIPNTIHANIPLFEKYPGYVFNFSGSRRYEFMKEYYPEDYAKVKDYVAKGRWFPAGSSVDENDAMVPSLESFQRQFLYGNRFFDREFGVHSDEFMLPDCFGFPASLPSMLHHGGVKGFSTQKLVWGSAVGIPFSVGVWIGPDGSEIVSAFNPLSYNGKITQDLSHSKLWLDRINVTGEKSGTYADYHYYGTGDTGGAPDEESVKWIEKSLTSDGPVKVVSTRADQMFNDITPAQAAKLPRYTGELLLTNHSSGAISSQAYMKRWNRKNELLANAAESAATAAAWLGAFTYPRDTFYRAWDLVLGSQMHDILPGTSLPTAYNYSWNDEVLALNQFAAITERASGAILSALDTRAEGLAVAVYNPLSIPREDPVEVLLPVSGDAPRSVTAFDGDGKPVPTQILGREGNALRVLFLAKAPSVGYAIYDLRTGVDASPKTGLTVTEKYLENARYRVTLDDGGDVASIFDKAAGRELLAAPARLGFHFERPKEYPAWNMDWADRQKPARGFVGGPATVRIAENGAARVTLEVTRTTENSTFVEQIRLAAGTAGDRVEYRTRIDWRSFSASLKTDYRFTVANPNATYDAQVGVVVRDNNHPTRFESPLHQWMDLTSAAGDYGVAVLNDSKYGSDKPADNALRLTLLYTPGVRDQYQDQGTQDQGRHEILYALAGHSGDWASAGIPWQAARLNQPLLAFLPAQHPGKLGKTFSLASLNSDQVQIVAIKQAEDSDEVVVRVKELTGRPAQNLRLAFPAAIIAAREVDGQERAIGPASLDRDSLAFEVKPWGVRAFAFKLAAAPVRVPAIASAPVSLAYDLDVASPDTARTDGALDTAGNTYPAEMLPATLVREGVTFQLGSTRNGDKNAVVARGQEIALPAGEFARVHLLVAARTGDFSGELKIGSRTAAFTAPRWTGMVGQWDTRLWPANTYNFPQVVGLVPGFIKRTPVAWFATHHHTPSSNAFYEFSYLFQADFDLPAGAKTLALPNDENLLVFAVSVSTAPAAPAAAPLYDTLAEHRPDALLTLPQAGRSFDDSTAVTLVPPLYHRDGDLRYTLDGTEPTVTSAVYAQPFYLHKTTTINARQILADGALGPVISGAVTINDRKPPSIVRAVVGKTTQQIIVEFSEPVAAGRAESYRLVPALPVSVAELSADKCVVTLTLGTPLALDTRYTLEAVDAVDLNGNKVAGTTFDIVPIGIVYERVGLALPDEKYIAQSENLPLGKTDTWTINMLVKPAVDPEDRTLIGGFGRFYDGGESGTGRYFAKMKGGIAFWLCQTEVLTNSPFEVGRWQMLTATYDGTTIALYKDGRPIGRKDVDIKTSPEDFVSIGLDDPWENRRTFHGRVQSFTIRRSALTPSQVKELAETTKPF